MTLELEQGNVIALSPVFGELLQGAKSGREERIILDLWDGLLKVDEREIFIRAGKLSAQKKLITRGVGLVDCSILLVALENDFRIWSLDQNLRQAATDLGISLY